MISPDLGEFMESGVSVLVGTRSDRLFPESCRAAGIKVVAEGTEVVVCLPVATSETTLLNLRDNGRIAVCMSRAGDHRSLQVKGQVLSIEPAGEEERQQILRYRRLLAESWGFIGIPPRITMRMAWWPSHAVRFRVEAVFNQTPGPGAGAALAAHQTPGQGAGASLTAPQGNHGAAQHRSGA